jgi:hypothetical protein
MSRKNKIYVVFILFSLRNQFVRYGTVLTWRFTQFFEYKFVPWVPVPVFPVQEIYLKIDAS